MCTEDNVDVHDIELMQYINVDCSKLKRLLQGRGLCSQPSLCLCSCVVHTGLGAASRNRLEVPNAEEAGPAGRHQQPGEGAFASVHRWPLRSSSPHA